jgi:hypothetical protein
VEAAEDKGEYRRLLDLLESRRIAAGRVGLRRLPGGALTVACAAKVTLGRDPLCELPLRAAGISRAHAEVVTAAEADGGWLLRDLGSKNGTLLAGLPVAGEVRLEGRGQFSLGDDCEIAFETGAHALRLEVARGLDKGIRALLARRPGEAMELGPVSGLAAVLRFEGGRPYLKAAGERALHLNGHRVAHGAVQLVREDRVAIDDVEVEVQ